MVTLRGFTLIELLVVLAIVALLSSLALPRYTQYLERTREAVLAENLRLARDALEQFNADRGRYPDSLDELVARRYLKALPVQPDPRKQSPLVAWRTTSPGRRQGRRNP